MTRILACLLLVATAPIAHASTDPRLRKAIPAPPGTTTVVGEVRSFTRDSAGRIDGFVLDSGVKVRLPPTSGPRTQQVVAPGRQVRVEGRIDHTGESSYQIDAASVNDTASGRTIFLGGPEVPPLW